MDELQLQIGKWGDATFGTEDDGSAIVAHLREEVSELTYALAEGPESLIWNEVADCAILLLQLAHRRNFSLRLEVEHKHRINVKRRWGKPDANGVVRHQEARDATR